MTRRKTEMTNKERAELIQNAIRDYKAAKESGDAQKIRFAVNYMENTFFAVSLWAVPGTEELRQMILSAKEDKARRIFGSYKRDLIRTAEISSRPQELRYNCIQYVCQFPGIDPAEMAASLQNDGFTILFDDSSISAKANAANRAAVNKTARRAAQ
jgi:hypothetical protein